MLCVALSLLFGNMWKVSSDAIVLALMIKISMLVLSFTLITCRSNTSWELNNNVPSHVHLKILKYSFHYYFNNYTTHEFTHTHMHTCTHAHTNKNSACVCACMCTHIPSDAWFKSVTKQHESKCAFKWHETYNNFSIKICKNVGTAITVDVN